MFVAVDGEPAGIVAVADTIKPSARDTLHRLKQMGIEAVMITGDNKRTAEAVARELGIERVFAEVLPADKARYVEQLRSEEHTSELQSRQYLVCRLLLEKKKNEKYSRISISKHSDICNV